MKKIIIALFLLALSSMGAFAQQANLSVSANNTPAPTSSTQIGCKDGSGKLQAAASAAPCPVTVISSALPTGAATSANQPALNGDGGALAHVTNFPATQPVSGTVAATQSGTWTVQPGNTANTTAWKVDGSAVTQPISAASLPLPTSAATSTKQSDGSQKTQIVDGSGNVIAATSNALNVNISSSGLSNQSVNVGQWGGSVTTLGSKPSGSSVPVVIASDDNVNTVAAQAVRATGTITANAQTVTTPVSQYSVATVTISGTYSGLVFSVEASDDGGTTYYPVLASDSSSTASAATSIAPGTNGTKMYNVTLPGVTNFRVRATAFTSGTANVGITATADPMVFNVAAGIVGIPTIQGNAASLAADSGLPVKTGYVFNTTQPTATTGQRIDAQATSRGAAIVAPGVDGFSVTANAGTNLNTSALALESGGNLATIASAILSQSSTTSGQKGALMQGAVTTGSPSYTTAQTNPLSLTTAGALRVDASVTTQPVSVAAGSDITEGNTTDAAVTGDNSGTVNAHLRGLTKVMPTALGANGGLKIEGVSGGTTVPVTGTVSSNPAVATTGGTTKWFVSGSLSNTVVQVQGSATNIYDYMVGNAGTGWCYLEFWNALSANVTIGTTAPSWVISVPPGGAANLSLDAPHTHGTALSVAQVSSAGGSSACATVPIVSIAYN